MKVYKNDPSLVIMGFRKLLEVPKMKHSSQTITHLMVLDLYSYSEFYKVKITRWLHVILSIQIRKINLTEQKKKYI